MRNIKFLIILLTCLLLACNNATKSVSEDKVARTTQNSDISANSIYLSREEWTNQDGQQMPLDDLSGKVQVIAMIFTSCGYACPQLVENMRAIELALPAEILNQVHFTLVSFDTQSDSAATLKLYASQKHLDKNWTLLHGSQDQVRMLSMLLEVKYSKLALGGFNHTNQIAILNQKGEIVKKIQGLDVHTKEGLEAIEAITLKK
ncbi:protein SCO1/2 [Arachidicoccus rhizosphaerae]|uniref:Protein SCO1/2 n=1 Tax=Arachidicoccus rhizosphaerae TaxID=551991 RepID=A0A1H3VK15_9BACT|nr:SCO family protein [Arachidicoccus rhizosphaerae]SDZ74452.1 protein SCO1/2 [Arachidicoccus rhizosphaerae]